MKIMGQALLGAAIFHILYFLASLAVGYVKTVTYRPNFSSAWENTGNLQSTVSLGTTTSPVFYMGTFLATALVCGLLLIAYKKLTSLPCRTETESKRQPKG